MDGGGQLDSPERCSDGATVVHRLDILQALLFEPGADFERRDDRCAGPLRDRHHIRHVIAVAMRNKNKIGGDFFRVDLLSEWIWGDEWIEEKRLSAGLDRKTGVSIVSKLHRTT